VLALADAPAINGIAQPPKRMPAARSAPAESAPAAAAVAPTVAAPDPCSGGAVVAFRLASAARPSAAPRFLALTAPAAIG
jgi:hypothetical protein